MPPPHLLAWPADFRHFTRIPALHCTELHYTALLSSIIRRQNCVEQRCWRWVRNRTRTGPESWLAGRCQSSPRPLQFLRLFLVRYNLCWSVPGFVRTKVGSQQYYTPTKFEGSSLQPRFVNSSTLSELVQCWIFAVLDQVLSPLCMSDQFWSAR